MGQAILESYSRVIESLAYTVLSRIDDVLYADSMTKNPSLSASKRRYSLDSLPVPEQTSPNANEEIGNFSSSETPPSMTLSDFIGWSSTKAGTDKKKTNSTGDLVDLKDKEERSSTKSPKLSATPTKKSYYLDKFEYLNAIRSPIARH